MERLTGEAAERLVRRSSRRRTDGARGMRARRAWARLIQACTAGDAAAQEAVRRAELPDADMLDLLAAAPQEPAERAAYLTLIGQSAQCQALDPDGSLLALTYRAATPELRERLRTLMAVEGDTDVIRVVVTGEQRDRIADMSYDELDYLGNQLALRRRWDELRRLALDLPPAKAVAAARLLPDDQRAGENGAALAALAGFAPGRLAGTIERLPRKRLTSHVPGGAMLSISPDQAAVAVLTAPSLTGKLGTIGETIQFATGERTERYRDHYPYNPTITSYAIQHLGDEIVLTGFRHMRSVPASPDATSVHPRFVTFDGPEMISSGKRRGSTGVVAVTESGLVFVDRGATHPRYVHVPRIAAEIEACNLEGPYRRRTGCRIATLPESRLIAIATHRWTLVVDESGTVRHYRPGGALAVSFLTSDSLAIIPVRHGEEPHTVQILRASSGIRRDVGDPMYRGAFDWIQSFPLPAAGGASSDTASVPYGKALKEVWGYPLDAEFARVFYGFGHPEGQGPAAVSAYGDVFVTSPAAGGEPGSGSSGSFEVYSPHLPAVREVLEQPLLHAAPGLWQRTRELRTKVGDPEAREALDLLAICLGDRFGGDVALGTGPVSAGGPHDVALGADRAE